MIIADTELEGVKLLTPTAFEDHRGFYVNLWNSTLPLLPDDKSWQEDDLSVSVKGVIRGFHGDDKTYKLVGCLDGRLFVVVVDYRGPKQNLQWQSFSLTGENQCKLLVPPGYGLAHQVLSSHALFWYKQSELYKSAESQFTINPFDPKLNIDWPIWLPGTYILSERDRNAPSL